MARQRGAPSSPRIAYSNPMKGSRASSVLRCASRSASLHSARGFSHGFLDGVDHQTLVEGRFPKNRGLRLGVVDALSRQGVLVRRLVPRFGEKRAAIGGIALIAAGFALVAFAATAGPVYAAIALVSIGSGFSNVAFSSLISLYSRTDEQGKVLGVFRSLGSLARAVGPLAAGVIFWWYGSLFTYVLGSVLLLVPMAAGIRLPQPEK